MAKRTKSSKRSQSGSAAGDGTGGPDVRVAALAVEDVVLRESDVASGPCAFCGRIAPLRHVVTISAAPVAPEVLGALEVCDEHAAPAARFLEHAFEQLRTVGVGQAPPPPAAVAPGA
jgi:hypothetical protein